MMALERLQTTKSKSPIRYRSLVVLALLRSLRLLWHLTVQKGSLILARVEYLKLPLTAFLHSTLMMMPVPVSYTHLLKQFPFYRPIYGAGLTAEPLILTSKCRWGPVLFPVEPTRAMGCPLATSCPALTKRALQ